MKNQLFLLVLAVCLCSSRPYAQDIALFLDANYVDTALPCGGEGNTVRNTLTTELGYTIANTITDINTNFSTALAGMDVLVIPEWEVGDIVTDMSMANKDAIRDFVNGGGTFLTFGGFNNTSDIPSRAVALLNDLFGYSLLESGMLSSGITSIIPTEAMGTIFEGGPDTLNNYGGTHLIIPSLPSNGKCIYKDDIDRTSVAVFFEGAGSAIYLGWDWFHGGTGCPDNDADWNDVLDRAINYVPPPPIEPIPAMDEWGVISLGLCMLILGIVAVGRRVAVA